MTVREFKKLVRAIPNEFNDFDVETGGEELIALIATPLLSERYECAFTVELVTSIENEKKKEPRTVSKTVKSTEVKA